MLPSRVKALVPVFGENWEMLWLAVWILKLKVLTPGIEGALQEGKLPLDNLGLLLLFPQKQIFFPAEALWKCLAPSCGLLCSELTEVPVPCCSSGISLFIPD